MADTSFAAFDPDADLRTPPSASDEELTAARNLRYQESRKQALGLQAIRDRNARSDMPPGSPTQYLDTYGNKLGPIQRDELGVQMPAPVGNIGLRGYPSAAEYAAYAARDTAQAKSDQFDSDVQDVWRRHPTPPTFQMPSTDQLIDAGIQSKRNAIESEINIRKVHLGMLPPSAAGLAATTLDSEQAPVTSIGRHGQRGYGASPASQTRAELAFLEHSAAGLDRAQAGVIQQNSRLAIQNAKDNEIFGQDVARAQVVDFLSGIDDSRYPHGSDDRQKFIGKVFGSRPDWLHVMAKDPHLSKYVQDHVEAQDKVASTIAQLKTLYPDMQVTPKSISGTGKVGYGVGMSAEDKAAARPVPEKAASRYAKLVGDITYHEKNQPVEEAANASANKPNTPYSEAAKWDAAIAEKQQLESRYPSLGGANKKAVQIPQGAMDALRNDPSLADDFDKKYGTGNAAIILR